MSLCCAARKRFCVCGCTAHVWFRVRARISACICALPFLKAPLPTPTPAPALSPEESTCAYRDCAHLCGRVRVAAKQLRRHTGLHVCQPPKPVEASGTHYRHPTRNRVPSPTCACAPAVPRGLDCDHSGISDDVEGFGHTITPRQTVGRSAQVPRDDRGAHDHACGRPLGARGYPVPDGRPGGTLRCD
jgi:hypothetical protein